MCGVDSHPIIIIIFLQLELVQFSLIRRNQKISASRMAQTSDDYYDLPEDVKTQTQIQNRYCFWCHRRGNKTSVDF